MDKSPIFWFFIGGLVLWIAEWIYDIYLWRRNQANSAPLLARASSAESQALSLKSDLDTHKSKLNAFDLQVSDLHSRLSTAQASALEHEQKVSGANEQLEKLKLKLGHMVEKKAVDTAQAEVNSLKAQLQTANQNLDALKPSAEKAAKLESQMVSLKASFEGSAQKSELDAANAEIASLKTRLSSYSEQTELFIQAKTRIGFLETELEASKTKLTTELEVAKSKSVALDAEVNKLKADGVMLMKDRLAPALERIQFLESQPTNAVDSTDSAELRAKLASMELEHSELHAKISSLTAQTETAQAYASGGSGQNDRIAMLETELAHTKSLANHSAADMAGLKLQLSQANEQLAALKANAGSGNQDAEIARLKAELAELIRVPKAPAERDRLEKIDGVGDVYEHRLNSAGVWTFAQLSMMNVETILNLIQPEAWQKIEPDKWILEAAERAKAKAAS
jgi:predicted flap endonuclease-1-like 5' DNA nuclease/ABC-type phosphate transport system auxiliary subunit